MIELRTYGKTSIIQAGLDGGNVVRRREEKVSVVGIHDEADGGQVGDSEAGDDAAKPHRQGLYGKVEQKAGQGVALSDPSAQGEEATVAAVNTDTRSAIMDDVGDHGHEVGFNAHSTHHMDEPGLINSIVGFSLVEAQDIPVGAGGGRHMGDGGSEPGMFGDVPEGDKTFLIRVDLGAGPRLQPGVNQVSIHFAVSVHRRNGTVVSGQGGVTFLEEQADISVFKVGTVSAVQPQVVGKGQESITEIRDVDTRMYSAFNTGGKRFPEAVLYTIRAWGSVWHLSAKGTEFLMGERTGRMYGGWDASVAVSNVTKERGLRNSS